MKRKIKCSGNDVIILTGFYKLRFYRFIYLDLRKNSALTLSATLLTQGAFVQF